MYNIYWSARYAKRNISTDPWDARTLEWHTASPVQFYNFAQLPEVKTLDAFWHMKKKDKDALVLKENELEEIHMPSNSGLPFIMCVIFGAAGFFMVFEWIPLAAIAATFIFVGLLVRSFDYNDGYHVKVDDIKKIERAWRDEK